MRLDVLKLSPILREVFLFVKKIQATDFYLKENSLPFFSIAGDSGKAPYFINKWKVEGVQLSLLLKRITKGELVDFLGACKVGENYQDDFSVEVVNEDKPIGRFRVNYARADGKITLSFRRLFYSIPAVEDLGLPTTLKEISEFSTGLVIVTGPTGSGKSTTLASVINYLTEDTKKSRVIVTVEKPIEYVFEDKNAFVMQREVGRDVDSFVSGIYNALRQKPNVIYVGEARTPEEIKAVLTASETGHLTLTTLHTSDAVSTISRIVDSFPPEEQPAVLTALSEELKMVVSQRLIPCLDGVVRPVCEILKVKENFRNLIKNRELTKLRDAMSKDEDCTLLDDELYKFCRVYGFIDEETAVRYSTRPALLKERLL